MRRTLIAAALIVLLVVASSQLPKTLAAFYLNLGSIVLNKALAAGQGAEEKKELLGQARGWLEQSVSWDPNSRESHRQLGFAYDSLGWREEAAVEWRTADMAGYFARLGAAEIRAHRYDKAVEAYQRAISTDPQLLEGYLALGHIYWLAWGKLPEAVEAYRQAATVAEPGSVVQRLVQAYPHIIVGEWSQAIPYLEEAIRLDPQNASAHRWLGVASRQVKDWTGAVGHLTKAISLVPQDSNIYIDLGHTYRDAGQYELASEWYWEAAQVDAANPAAPRSLAALARLYREQGDKEAALAELQKAVALRPASKEYRLSLAWLYRALDMKDEARKEYQKVLELDPQEEDAQKGLAEVGR